MVSQRITCPQILYIEDKRGHYRLYIHTLYQSNYLNKINEQKINEPAKIQSPRFDAGQIVLIFILPLLYLENLSPSHLEAA